VHRILLESKAAMDAVNNDAATPLHLASRYAHTNCVHALLKAGAMHAACVETRHVSALHNASYSGVVECIQALLEAKANVDERDADHWTPLHYATRFNNLNAIECLLKANADVNAVDIIGWTPCHNASRSGLLRGVEILLQYGADVSILNSDFQTPLHVASRQGKTKVVAVLVHNADKRDLLKTLVKQRDIRGASPHSIATSEYIRAILRCVRTHGCVFAIAMVSVDVQSIPSIFLSILSNFPLHFFSFSNIHVCVLSCPTVSVDAGWGC